jgi:hypothetical protein
MPLYEISEDGIHKIEGTTFGAEGLKERDDLQRLLRTQIEIVSPDTLIIAEEFGERDASRRQRLTWERMERLPRHRLSNPRISHLNVSVHPWAPFVVGGLTLPPTCAPAANLLLAPVEQMCYHDK